MADERIRRASRAYAAAGPPLTGEIAEPAPLPPAPEPRHRWPKWATWTLRGLLLLVAALIAWLAFTAPLSRSLQPLGAPSITVLSAEGEVIVRKGARIAEPVDVDQLPPYVAQAFIAVEDKRFFRHLGVDPWGLGRALLHNVRSGGTVEGGSTITQQLAKTSFTGSDRTAFRKVQEAFIALWLEAWLSKEEILSRYLSNVYFGDNVFGLRAASRHYFSVEPERLTLEQAAMLAAIVNAPSRLAPTHNLAGAQERSELVLRRMRDAGFITERQMRAVRPVRLHVAPDDHTPTGTYFADWVLANAADPDDDSYGERQIQTTLELRLQRIAERAVRTAGVGRAQVALVAMRTDGRVVAMVGGRNYQQNAFNRATQARRQPGSTFKLFVYLAALRHGWRPDTIVDDSPVRIGSWSPQNYGGHYSGRIPLADALAQSSNSVAARLAQQVGMVEVIRAARDLGVYSPLDPNPSLALGTSGVSLLEMTAAYAAIAADSYPVTPYGLAEDGSRIAGQVQRRDPNFAVMRALLNGVTTRGTGTAANLSITTYGKTGTTQDYRDALFIGFAGDLVVGVWVGNDDNSPMPGVTGGSIPARIWRGFMSEALNVTAFVPPRPAVVDNAADANAANAAEADGNAVAPDDQAPSDEPLDVSGQGALPPPTAPDLRHDEQPDPRPADRNAPPPADKPPVRPEER
jgi:penicillin-binding protein 1A